jgi:diaminopimelate decarboxylase
MSKNTKAIPFSSDLFNVIIDAYGSPLYIYDEQAIRENIRRYIAAFSWLPNFRNFFAVKACPNPYILRILLEEGCGMDCSSMGELKLAKMIDPYGIKGEDIMFTSNNTPRDEFFEAEEMKAIINFDDITHIDFFIKSTHALPEIACCRYNPGPLKKGNSIIGNPEDAKYGMTKSDLFEAYRDLKKLGVKRFGLHTMVASNELDPMYFVETARILFELVIELEEKLDIEFEFVNLGGGIGIPYKPEDEPVDYELISSEMKVIYEKLFKDRNNPLNVVTEMGRMVTGPYGYLITKVRHIKDIYKSYVGVDASMADLMRPGLYGAYHHITVLNKSLDHVCEWDVTGSLCENNDKFAINRQLPDNIEKGDILVIHDVGAHGHAMGFNYNAKLRPAELLWRGDADFVKIRRAETLDDYFATLDFEGSNYKSCK